MYRTAARWLFCSARQYYGSGNVRLRFRHPQVLTSCSCSSISERQLFSNPNSTDRSIPITPNFSDSASSSSSTPEDPLRYKTPRSEAKYEDQQTRVLQASLPYIIKLGWTEAAQIAGARDVSLSPSIVGSFSRKESTLVEYFMDDCLQRLVDKVDSDESLKNLTPSDCISKLIRFCLEMQAPYISTWPQALYIQAEILPSLEDEHIANIPYSGECLIQGKSKAWVGISRAEGAKCERCWNYSQQVGSFLDHPTLCTHCNDVVTLHMHSQVAAVS